MSHANTFMAGIFFCMAVYAAAEGHAWAALADALIFAVNAFAAFMKARRD